ncbi:ZYBA0S04-04302g1_1 [Zygosaccharomyces bailii CLIB 213]|uniref:Glycerophosphocholine acyltransferase 1 n=1 Tax=Zygosaccharomyces bailii (strain CLIB 213 / ATCC 58445 / CBS 680 / BCRC 21525 / NBRC 1098 / NCYC 1416 / NRRL Y-2227) TaxID=1333698 RepID=A0A8J2T6K8_ZYGB2|nr:ZYBA0S04-04302g1_1 [Zygosaccharomyces bailii CLIB 213]
MNDTINTAPLHRRSSSDGEPVKGFSKVSLSSLLELLDPLASDVSLSYGPNNYLTKARKRWKGFDRPKFTDTSDRRQQLEEWRSKVQHRVKALDPPLQNIFFNNGTKLEKLFYPFTIVNIFLVGFLMGKFPEWFHVYYTAMFCFLMPIRFYTYYKTNNHYFLADLCYFTNLLCLLFIWVFPDAINLYQTCFALTFGSLSFAVITWRNSLVLHSLDKCTSCFIHIMPLCTMYVIHHGLSENFQDIRFPAASRKHAPHWSLKKNIVWTSFYYLIWQSLYHYFITIRQSSKIKAGERMTSFEYLTTHTFKDFWMVKLPSPWPMLIYIFAQYFYQLTTMCLCGIWYNYRKSAATFLMTVFLCAAHNGATYYIDFYGRRYEKDVNKLRDEVEILQQQLKLANGSSVDNVSFTSSTTDSTGKDNEDLKKYT